MIKGIQIKWMLLALIISLVFVIGFDGTVLKSGTISWATNVLRVKFVLKFQFFLSLVPCGIWY
jgi:uncharacterized membrane protein YtjA (UPF0391 family)